MSTPRIVVLTGVTRGLGRAMLKELVAAGRTVAGCGRNAGHIETLRREYPAPHLLPAWMSVTMFRYPIGQFTYSTLWAFLIF